MREWLTAEGSIGYHARTTLLFPGETTPLSTLPDRFFLKDWPQSGPIALEGDEAKHAVRVRRLGPGDAIELFNGQGRVLLGAIRAVSPRSVAIDRIAERDDDRLPARAITIAVAPPKGERLDWLVEKATELGVRRLILLRTERGVVDPGSAKIERLRRLSIEACKQSGRNRLMEIEGPIPWDRLLHDDDGAVKLICDPSGAPVSEVRRERSSDPPGLPSLPALIFAVGPEGGFTDRETESARAANWRAVRLAPAILRIETAALAAAVWALS